MVVMIGENWKGFSEGQICFSNMLKGKKLGDCRGLLYILLIWVRFFYEIWEDPNLDLKLLKNWAQNGNKDFPLRWCRL